MRVRTIIAAAMFSFALALVGCSDPQPKEPDGPTATPTQVAPTLPEAATEDSEEGAVAFVKHYIELLNYAANTGDVKPLREASDPNCEGCNSYIALFEETYANGGYFRDSLWTIDSITSPENRQSEWFAAMITSAPDSVFVKNNHAEPDTGHGWTRTLNFEISQDGESPRLMTFEREPEK